MFVSVPETVQQTTSDIILHHIIQYEVQSFKIIILKKENYNYKLHNRSWYSQTPTQQIYINKI